MGDHPAATHEGVAQAKNDFNDSLRKLRTAARALDAKSSNPLELLTKVRFSEEELRSLIRLVSELVVSSCHTNFFSHRL